MTEALVFFLELQHIIRTQHLFLFDAEVDSGDAGVGVIEEFRELDERKFALSLGRRQLEDLLPNVLRSEWVEKCLILRLYFFLMSFRRTLILWTE